MNYHWPWVLGHAGGYKAEHVRDFEDLDLAVVEIRERLDDAEGSLVRGPDLFADKPSLGLSVGIMTHCEGLLNTQETYRQTCFLQHSVMMKDPLHDSRFVLTSGLVQKSFSGSPVYTSSYQLVGVLVGRTKVPFDIDNRLTETLTCPVMSPIFSILDELLEIIRG